MHLLFRIRRFGRCVVELIFQELVKWFDADNNLIGRPPGPPRRELTIPRTPTICVHSVPAENFSFDSSLGGIKEKIMLWTIILVLLVLWALGFGFAGAAIGNLIHVLLVVALVVLILQLVRGNRAI